MINDLNSGTGPRRPTTYQIRVEGHLGCQWTDWFDGLAITLEENGDTLLTGPVLDQAALFGLLKKVRDLGLPLVWVIRMESDQPHESDVKRQSSSYVVQERKNKMKTDEKISSIEKRQGQFSTLWIFAMFNYLYCDVLALMNSDYLKQVMSGNVAGMHFTPGFLLGAGILMEIPTAMVLLSRILKHRANRWANLIAGVIMTVVQISSVFVGSPTIYYIFFSIIEIACTAFAVWYAWMWTDPEGQS